MNDEEERWLLLTELEAMTNLRTMLELCTGGELKVSDRTSLPAAATVDTITEHLVNADF